MRMTKPISYHLTTGTFNYVVKDPDCIHLSGQLWIKDELGIARVVSSNLMRCFRLYLLLASALVLLLTGPYFSLSSTT